MEKERFLAQEQLWPPTNDSDISEGDLPNLRQYLEKRTSEAISKKEELETELKNTTKQLEQFWQPLLEADKSRNCAQIALISRREASIIDEIRNSNTEQWTMLESYFRKAEEMTEKTARHFSTLFPKACEKSKIIIDSNSRHPEYKIHKFIQTSVDEQNLTVRIKPRDGNSAHMPLDINSIVKHLQSEIKRLFITKRGSKTFLKGLKAAYYRVIRKEKMNKGVPVKIHLVIKEFLCKNKKYGRDEFNIDLSVRIQSKDTIIDDVRLNLGHTRNSNQGILLYNLEQNGYVGFINFKPREQHD